MRSLLWCMRHGGNSILPGQNNMKDKHTIGLFFGSSTCYTAMVADTLAGLIPKPWRVHLHNVKDINIELLMEYRLAIYGIPTWDYGELQEDWDNCWDGLQSLHLPHQKAAIYGLGDQIGYPEWFQDCLGYLHDCLAARGAELCGYWPRQSDTIDASLLQYSFQQSQGLSDDGMHFLGLPLDEENQPELSEARCRVWLRQVLQAFASVP